MPGKKFKATNKLQDMLWPCTKPLEMLQKQIASFITQAGTSARTPSPRQELSSVNWQGADLHAASRFSAFSPVHDAGIKYVL